MVLGVPLIRPIGTLARMPVVDLENCWMAPPNQRLTMSREEAYNE